MWRLAHVGSLEHDHEDRGDAQREEDQAPDASRERLQGRWRGGHNTGDVSAFGNRPTEGRSRCEIDLHCSDSARALVHANMCSPTLIVGICGPLVTTWKPDRRAAVGASAKQQW